MFVSGGNLLILELACGVDSVIQMLLGVWMQLHWNSCRLELPSTQRQAYKFFKSFAEGSSGSADSQKLIQVHISLPCTGVALCWTYPRKTGNLLRMRISGFLIIARDMFHISRA